MVQNQGRHRFDGEVVVVTGAGRGLGRGYAEAFARHGATVVVVDLDDEAVAQTVAAIVDGGGSAYGITADVVQATDVVSQVMEQFSRLDVLVNNAGIAHSSPFTADSVVDIERLIRVHTIGTAAMTAGAWSALQAANGRVVNVTSGALFGLPLHTAYATAKGGVLGLTRALAREPDSSVRVNAVMPMARTRMFEAGGGTPGSPEDELISQYCPPELAWPPVVFLGWSGVPCNGQVFEVAGSAMSRIVFATGPNVSAHNLEDIEAGWAVLNQPTLTEVETLEGSFVSKLQLLMAE